MSYLEVSDIHTYYGQSYILQGVSLDVNDGEVVALLGRNGAGKTTTLRSIMGLTPPREGSIRFKSESIEGLDPYQIAHKGIGYVPEGRDVFADLTVADNIEVVSDEDSTWSHERIYEAFPSLEERTNQVAHSLSGGEQQMLSIARALATGPDMLILDEPSEGLAPSIINELKELLVTLTDELTVLLTEQNVEFALDLADRAFILNKGQIEWEGDTAELREDPDIIERYLVVSAD